MQLGKISRKRSKNSHHVSGYGETGGDDVEGDSVLMWICVVVQIVFQLSHYYGWDMPQLPGDPELGTRLRK